MTQPIITTYPNRANWLEARKGGIGASDVWRLVYKKFELWAEKCGLDNDGPERSPAAVEAMEWGLRLERPIGKSYAENTGRHVDFPEPYTVWRCPDAPLSATLDAMIAPTVGRGPGVLQIKNVDKDRYRSHPEEWADGPPLMYQCQTQAEMLCSGLDWGVLAALIGGNKLRAFDLEFNADFAEQLKIAAREFWALVESRTPPDVDASESCRQALQRLHPDDDGSEVELPDEAMAWATALTDQKANLNFIKDICTSEENKLRAAIGAATFGVLPDGRRISYKTQERAAHQVKASKFRVLRIPKVK